MKKFMEPAIDMIKFAIEDVVTTSGPQMGEDETEGGSDL